MNAQEAQTLQLNEIVVRLEDAQDQARPEEELCLNSVAG
jgi:hypothetical protein